MSGRGQVARALRKLGFTPLRQRGSHVLFRHADGRIVIAPRHEGEDIGRGVLREILRQAGVDWETFEELT